MSRYYSDENGKTVYTIDKDTIFKMALKESKRLENTLVFSIDIEESAELEIKYQEICIFIQNKMKDYYV